uniref:Superoxide dismutase 3, extracellular a n=1 Tax=Astyanax mexicanus TaxID=7994 RepID=W5LTK8_ASTMX
RNGNVCSILLLLLSFIRCLFEEPVMEAPMELELFNRFMYGTCEVNPDPLLPAGLPQLYGQVLFRQFYPSGAVQVIVNLRGLPTNDKQERAIHIHQYGDLSEGFVTAGPHYNPLGVDHPSHPGDLGNFFPSNGTVRRRLNVQAATLFGGPSILGRAVVIHEKEDDLGLGSDEESKRSGNAGRRIAGCVIGISSETLLIRIGWE